MNVLDRKQAAEVLKVSVRTIDRYIQRGLLSTDQVNGRIFIKYKDLKPLINQKNLKDRYLEEIDSQQFEGNYTNREVQPEIESVSDNKEASIDTSEFKQISELKQAHDQSIYKKLYEELQEELKQKQERLEGANYRVGQLEGLLKESVPLIEYRKALAVEGEKRSELEELLNDFEKDNELLNQTVDAKRQELEQLSEKLQIERFNKKVFIIILIVLFLLQPLWLLFPAAI
jgi:hypothetical protein